MKVLVLGATGMVGHTISIYFKEIGVLLGNGFNIGNIFPVFGV